MLSSQLTTLGLIFGAILLLVIIFNTSNPSPSFAEGFMMRNRGYHRSLWEPNYSECTNEFVNRLPQRTFSGTRINFTNNPLANSQICRATTGIDLQQPTGVGTGDPERIRFERHSFAEKATALLGNISDKNPQMFVKIGHFKDKPLNYRDPYIPPLDDVFSGDPIKSNKNASYPAPVETGKVDRLICKGVAKRKCIGINATSPRVNAWLYGGPFDGFNDCYASEYERCLRGRQGHQAYLN